MIGGLLLLWQLLVPTASAQAVDLCVDVLTNFLDADYVGPVSPGDWWERNAARPARGVWLEVVDGSGTQTLYTDIDGCTTVGVNQTNPAQPMFAVTVQSLALVNGVYLSATDGASFDHPACANGVDCPGSLASVTFLVPYSATSRTLTVSTGDQRWNLLAVAQWAMYRNTFHLGTYSSRDCCLETSAADYDAVEGTCSDPSDQYRNAFDATQMATTIELMSNGSGDSRRRWLSGTEVHWEPTVGVSVPRRFLIGHELGHVLVMKRMGERTANNADAVPEGCTGDYRASDRWLALPVGDHSPTLEDLNDPEPLDTDDDDPGTRGSFSKEYQSMAAREGWATFVAVWLFNRRTESDGQMDFWTIHDLDRDGRLDNNYGDPDTSDTADSSVAQDAWGDGVVDMGINPVTVTPGGVAPLDPSAIGWDWLEQLIAASDAPGGDPALGCDGTLDNRGTAYDWARFFWDMTLTSGGGIRPEDLADLYVDMCPTNWDAGDEGVAPPIDRLEASAVHHGGAIHTEWSIRKVWGQDH